MQLALLQLYSAAMYPGLVLLLNLATQPVAFLVTVAAPPQFGCV